MDLEGDHLTLCDHFFTDRLNGVKMCEATSDWIKMERDALKDCLLVPYYGTSTRMICQLMLKT